MALLIYTEMAWVIPSQSYLYSHTNDGVTYLLLQTSKQMMGLCKLTPEWR